MSAADGQLPRPIVVDSVSKSFRVPEERAHTLKERALHPRRRTRYQTFEALKDISLEVQHGEFFGIAGRNGSGKSTLLKCMAGIYGVDRGRIWMNGRLSTFIELGVGFNEDLAARDNVVLNGIMMGLSPREARSRYDAVMDFAELREFEELKLKNYSSGMRVRLAFSVACQVDADILLVDEVLAVGDAAFAQKCFEVFERMREERRTIVFVTHDMAALNRFCHRAMLLERGAMLHLGDPHEVADRYLEVNFNRGSKPDRVEGAAAAEEGDAHVVDAWLEDGGGERREAVAQGQRMTLKALVRFAVDVEDAAASIYVLNEQHVAIIVATTALAGEPGATLRAGEEALMSFSFENVLAPGRYNPLLTLAGRGRALKLSDGGEGAFSFMVTGVEATGGVVDVPVEAGIERKAAATTALAEEVGG
jgi:ABC-type polysaccharide/polyol phosphate transport system ATPase subunit